MLWHRGKAGDYEVHEPPDTHTDDATDAMQGDFLTE
jgi:hypothetical protein